MADLDFPNSPTLNQVFLFWQWDGVKWPAAPATTGATVPVVFPWIGKPPSGAMVNVPMTLPMTIAPGLVGTTVFANSLAAAGAQFTVNQITPAGVVTQLGLVTLLPTGRTSCNLSGPGGSLAIGDDLQLVAPALQDANLADFGITLLLTRA